MQEIKNNKEIQPFNSIDVLSILFCFVVVICVGFGFFRIHLEQKKTEIAKNYVENLAQELIKQPVNSSQESRARLPASVDSQLDPWGQPYKHVVVRNSYGQPIYLVILSGGPKKKIVTNVPETMSFPESQIENLKINSADIGYIKSYR